MALFSLASQPSSLFSIDRRGHRLPAVSPGGGGAAFPVRPPHAYASRRFPPLTIARSSLSSSDAPEPDSSPANITDEWGEKAGPEAEAEASSYSKLSDSDPPRGDDEWGGAGGVEEVAGVNGTPSAQGEAAAAAAVEEEVDKVGDLKRALVDTVYGTDFGFRSGQEVRAEVLEPRIFLSALAFGWGVVMIGMGLVKTWPELAGLRVILGVFEAGYFPGAVYLLSTWYTRYEMGKRYAVFYIIGCVASAFAGILAFGLMQMDGLAGKTGWRWIFIIEGILTCLIGIGAYIFLVGFPDDGAEKSWGFLKKAEIDWIIRKVDADRGDVALEPFTIGRFMRGGADWKIWIFALMFCFSTTVSYALAYFLPIILRGGMGFSVGEAQCLVAPPFVFAGIWMYLCGWYGDKYRLRSPVIATNAILQVVGLCLMGYGPGNAVKYFGVFLACAGANCSVPAILTYQANNIRGQWKRAFCSASLVGFGGIGGIIGSLVFRPQDAPRYLPGLWSTMVASGLVLIMVGILTLFFRGQNAKADRGELNIEGSEEGFRYTY